MRRLCTEGTHRSVVTLCVLFGKTKQAYYKYDDNRYLEYLAKENFILEYVKEVRRKDPGIGGEKLWYMYRQCFGDEHAVGRDRFMGIISKYGLNVRKRVRHPRTTDSSHHFPKHPDLTRTLLPCRPNELWVSDITYILLWLDETHYTFCYLSIITDAYSKEIIGYCVGETLESIYALKALEMAFKRLKGVDEVDLIHHSDRGVQYASFEYTSGLHAKGVRISMTESGNPKDNAVAERVNGIIKHELLKDMRFHTIEKVRGAVKTAVGFYNNERPHMSLDMMTPAQAATKSGILNKKWVSYREKYLLTNQL